jgi:hypothetical protein
MRGRRMSNVYNLLRQADDAKAQVAALVEAGRPFEARALAREAGIEEEFVDDLIKVQNEKARLKLRDEMAAVMAEPAPTAEPKTTVVKPFKLRRIEPTAKPRRFEIGVALKALGLEPKPKPQEEVEEDKPANGPVLKSAHNFRSMNWRLDGH